MWQEPVWQGSQVELQNRESHSWDIYKYLEQIPRSACGQTWRRLSSYILCFSQIELGYHLQPRVLTNSLICLMVQPRLFAWLVPRLKTLWMTLYFLLILIGKCLIFICLQHVTRQWVSYNWTHLVYRYIHFISMWDYYNVG